MQTIHINIQRYNFWSKWIMGLFLLPAFELRCLSKKPLVELLHNTMPVDLPQVIAHKNISKPVNGIDWLQAAIHDGDPYKVKVVLDKLNKDKKSRVTYGNNFPNSVGPNGNTALATAIEKAAIENVYQSNYHEIVKLLCDNQHIDTNNVGYNKKGPTALLIALNNKDPITAQIIVDHSFKLSIITPDPQSGATPLHFAIQNKWTNLTESLLNKLPINRWYVKDNRGKTPLHLAIESGDESLAECFIKNVSYSAIPLDNLCAQDENGNTPLHLAIDYKHKGLAKLLILHIKHYSSKTLSLDHLSIQNNKQKSPLDLANRNNMKEIFV